MGQVDWSESALNDLREQLAYSEERSTTYAVSLSERLLEAVDRLSNAPRSGWRVAEFDDPSIRETFVAPYRLIYSVRGEDCRILAIVHAARDLPDRFRSDFQHDPE